MELVGGADDGEPVYPFYGLQISHLVELFDEPPEVSWDAMHNELSVEGLIDGDQAWITFSREPFADAEPEDVLDPEGNLRKKNPPQE